MPGIHLYSSNRLEILADIFAELLAGHPLPPLQRETILIQSRGMERWLAMETAKRTDIWANCYCPFPNTFIREIYTLLLQDIPAISPYKKDTVLWHLMEILQEMQHEQHFQKVAAYLETVDDLKLYQLAYETADLFDQYTLFRPQMILDWDNNTAMTAGEHSWQQITWRCLTNRLRQDIRFGEVHRARLLQLFEEKINTEDFDPAILPPRITVFGISSLPPYHLKVLTGLAQHVDLHFFIMNPCREFWSDIVADRDIPRISRGANRSEDSLHLQEGNSLLASMGHLGRDFLALLQETNCQEHEFFQEPDTESLLAYIQDDILNLRETPSSSPEQDHPKRKKVPTTDKSLTFHSCHSQMREVEVLYDQLLDIFNSSEPDAQIDPRDILVMVPSIDEYSPLIQALFDAETSGSPKIPYTIADQSIRQSSAYIETFISILELYQKRFSSIDVFGILESEAVRNRFDIPENDLSTIAHWIEKTRICWGIDAEHKKNLALPPYHENTWRAGLDRLLLGYAMVSHDQSLFADILAYDHVEGDITKLLGSFLDFCEILFKQSVTLKQDHTLAEWSEILLQMKDDILLADESNEAEDRILHQLILHLRELQEKTAFNKKLSLSVIRSFLIHSLDDNLQTNSGAAGFLTGGVTFCSMLPMRAIPFKFIFLLGMNDGHYPRSGRKRSFDLMAHDPKRGDRSKRYDDRYLFLETILSARRKLSISYVGQSIQDGSKRPPSVLVSELMDYIDRGFSSDNNFHAPGVTLSNNLTTLHHLQPFHPGYFSPESGDRLDNLFSYSAENCQAANALISPKRITSPLFSGPLPDPPEQFRQLELSELIRFFSHPARYLMLRIIGIAPIEENRILETNEPFMLTALARYKLEKDVLETILAGGDCGTLYSIKKAAGELPHGQVGKIYFQQLVSEMQSFHKTLAALVGDHSFRCQQFNLQINDFTITGIFDTLHPIGLLQYRYAKVKPGDVIRSWISHLVLNSLQVDGDLSDGGNTYFVGKDSIFRYNPPVNSRQHLEDLLNIYWQGLKEPLYFFPWTSYVFAREVHSGKTERQAMQKAMTEWKGDGYRKNGEKNDPYNQLCYKNPDLPNPLFREIAEKVFLVALQHQEKHR